MIPLPVVILPGFGQLKSLFCSSVDIQFDDLVSRIGVVRKFYLFIIIIGELNALVIKSSFIACIE